MDIAEREWPHLQGKLKPVADQNEMIKAIGNHTNENFTTGLCFQFFPGSAGGMCVHVCKYLYCVVVHTTGIAYILCACTHTCTYQSCDWFIYPHNGDPVVWLLL